MAESLSRSAKVATSPNDGVYTDIAGLRDDISFDGSRAEIDSTDRDTAGFTTNVPGRGSATMSFTAHYDPGDAGQAALETAFDAGTQVWIRYRPATGGGLPQRKALATITSFKASSPNDALNLISVSVKFSGDFSKSAQ